MNEKRKSNARDTALEVLLSVSAANAWSDGSLKRTIAKNGLDSRDAALASRIAYGVIQNRMYLDYYISLWCTQKAERLEPLIRNILRIGAYQILFMDKIPHRAAVNEAVEMTKRHGRPKAAGMVNAVLRKFVTNWLDMPELPRGSTADYLSLRYSHPKWLVTRLIDILGAEEAEEYLRCNNAIVPTTIQTNTTKITPDALAETLAAQGVTVETHPWLDGCFTLRGTGDLEQLKAFRDGLFLVQDTASRLVVLAAQPEAGQHILDACGAPGGKSFSTAIAIGDDGSILSCDIHPSKVKQIQKGAKRLGLASIQSQIRNAKEYDPSLDEQFDLVLADAPCSGLGIIRKKPDIRNKDPEPLKDLPRIQGDILENVSRYVKSGGVLVYSTCTVLERENQDVVRGFLAKHPEFTLEPFTLPDAIGTVEEGMLTLWPHIHGTDGFFLSKMRKQGT